MLKRVSLRRRALLRGALYSAAGLAATGAWAQGDDGRPVRWLLPYPAGGAADTVSRILAVEAAKALGRPIVVDNRPGGSTFIAVQALRGAPADGSTMMVVSNDTLAINPHLFKAPYDAERDFAYVAEFGEYQPSLLVARADLPARDLRDAIALFRSKGESISFASHGIGSVSQIRMEMFLAKIGTRLNHVPYKGSAPALQDIAGGQVDVLVDSQVNAMPMVRAGKVKALAVLGPERLAELPQVLTLAEAGAAAGDFATFQGLIAAKGTPPAAVQAMAAAVRTALAMPAVRDAYLARGMKPVFRDGDAFRAIVRENSEAMRRIVEERQLTAQGQ
jgi:tripartite-type tricarboxylate transporter receptor subunit TctC